MTTRPTGPTRPLQSSVVVSARRARLGQPPVFVPASPRDLAEESGLSLDSILLLLGEPELEEYRDAIERRNAARLEIALVEWQRAWEMAATGGSREWTEAEMDRLDRASTDCVWLSHVVDARRPALDAAVYAARARRSWLQRARRGLDLDGMVREAVARVDDPHARPSSEIVRLTRRLVEYRVVRVAFDRRADGQQVVFTPVPIDERQTSSLLRRIALFGDSDRRPDSLAPYTLLHELVRRDVSIVIEESAHRRGPPSYQMWVKGADVMVRSADLGQFGRTPRDARVIPDLFESPTSVHLLALAMLEVLDLEVEQQIAAA